MGRGEDGARSSSILPSSIYERSQYSKTLEYLSNEFVLLYAWYAVCMVPNSHEHSMQLRNVHQLFLRFNGSMISMKNVQKENCKL